MKQPTPRSLKTPQRLEQLLAVQQEAASLFERKHRDYGDSFADHGPVGVLIRIHDKLNRIRTIERNKVTMVDTESARDTLIDLVNYAAMAVLLLDENQ